MRWGASRMRWDISDIIFSFLLYYLMIFDAIRYNNTRRENNH